MPLVIAELGAIMILVKHVTRKKEGSVNQVLNGHGRENEVNLFLDVCVQQLPSTYLIRNDRPSPSKPISSSFWHGPPKYSEQFLF